MFTFRVQKSLKIQYNYPAISKCTQNDHLHLVELLLKENADPNVHKDEGCTALMLGSQNGCLHIVELLLMANADANAHSSTGWTALLLPSKYGHSNVVKMLLQHKANPHIEISKHLDSFTIATLTLTL